MTICEQLRADAPGLAALPPDDPQRTAAWEHAAACEGCARALQEAERLQAVLGAWSPDPVSAATLSRAAAAIAAELSAERRRTSAWTAVAAGAFAIGLVAFARHRGGSALDWTTALLLAAVAMMLAALSGRRPWLSLGGVVAVALAGALVEGRPGPLEVGAGLECLLWELVAAAVVALAGWLALRGGTTAPPRSALAAAAAAGALAGDAGLQVTCAAHGVGPHLLAFHVGGVLLAAGLASLVWRPRSGDVTA